MKALKYILSAVLLLVILGACTKDEFGSIDFVGTAKAPENITALYGITQDNTGLVTITPNGEGANSFDIHFGDLANNTVNLKSGEFTTHTYLEGSYNVKILAYGITGLKTEVTQPLVVSFKAPENLEVIIENDLAVSKKVNVTANADFATFFDVYFGEVAVETPVSANIGATASYTYQEAGTYSIRVVAKGGAIQTTEYIEEFVVTAILQPIASAPTQPSRLEADVISIYSSVYTDVAGCNYNPDWGQSGQGSSYAEFDLNGDKMLQYINLSYQGIDIGSPVDASSMEFLHIDIWTADVVSIDIYPLPVGVVPADERFVTKELVADQWNSFDIPLSDFTDQGLPLDNLGQFKFVGNPWAGGTVFIDNIYFHKAPSELVKLPITFDSEVHTFTPFLDAEFALSVDPEDASNAVGMITNHGGGWGWEGVSLALDEWVNFSVHNTITMDFYTSTLPHKVLMKFEDTTSPRDGNNNPTVLDEVEVDVTATGWSKLSFTYSSTNPYNQIVIFVDGNVYNITGTYYIDNIEQVGATPSNTVTPITFENPFEISSFDGGKIALVENPDGTVNTSKMALQLIKGPGQTWAGSKITVDEAFSFATSTSVSVKVWSPRVGLNLLMKFEDATPWPNTVASAEVVGTSTVANAWETLTFDFSGISTSTVFNNLVLIMDNGTAGDASANYTLYVDDISVKSYFDFEQKQEFSSFDGGKISLVANPDATNNASTMVAKLVKGAGQTWAGSKITVPQAFSFANSTSVTIKVYSPRVGLNLLAKFEDSTPWPNTVASAEIVATTTVAGAWEELTFDFSGISTSTEFMNLVLIMDNGTAGDGSADYTLYIDDITQI